MTNGEKIEDLRQRSFEAEAQGNYKAGIALSHDMLDLIEDNRVHLQLAAFQWERVALMHLRLNQPIMAEEAARKSLETYLRKRAVAGGNWTPERDCYLADFRMTLALSLAYQKRYTEALDCAEQWEKVHFNVRNADDPFIKDVVVPHMKRLRARKAGDPVPEDAL